VLVLLNITVTFSVWSSSSLDLVSIIFIVRSCLVFHAEQREDITRHYTQSFVCVCVCVFFF
jgi:hypothetical protein